MNEKSLIPAIRFAGFAAAWERRKVEELAIRVSSIGEQTGRPRVEYEDIISGMGQLNKDIFTKVSNKPGIEFSDGDVLYGKLRPYLKNWLLPNFNGLAVGDFWVLHPQNVDSKFLFRLIQSRKFEEVANQSAGTKMPRADWKLVSKTDFGTPLSLSEQRKVGSFFETLDTLITLHQRKHEKLLNIKKSMLEKMFPKNGELIPEVRFAGFTDAWERRKLFDNIQKITDFRGRTPKKLGMEWSSDGYLALSALNVKNGYIDYSEDAHYGSQELYDKWMSGNELHQGQVLFTTEAPMGNVAQVPDGKRYILSQRTIAFEVKDNMITENFLAVLLRTPHVFSSLTSMSSGGTAKGISQKLLATVEVIMPGVIDEQNAIATLFLNLDRLITLHQRKLEKLQNIKKACLEKIFV